MNFDDFKALIGMSFRDPQGAARVLIGQNWPFQARWMALVVAVSISAMLAWFAGMIFGAPPAEDGGQTVMLARQPIVMAAMHLGAIILAAGLMANVGRMFGGQGRFDDALLLTAWIEFLLLMVQIAQIMLLLFVPVVAGILGILAIGLSLFLTVQFTQALHGFRSSIRVFLVMIATLFVVASLLTAIAAVFGLLPVIAHEL